jgi:hypothetical protein
MAATPQDSSGCSEVRLDSDEKRLESATFLFRVESALFVGFCLYSAIWPGSIIGSFYIFAMIWPLARMQSNFVLLTTLLLGLGFGVVPYNELAAAGLGRVPAAVGLWVLLALCLPAGFGLRIIVDGWRLGGVRKHDRELFAVMPPGVAALSGIIARAFGVHPLSRLIPQLSRRTLSMALFIVSGALYGSALLLLVMALSNLEYITSPAFCLQDAFTDSDWRRPSMGSGACTAMLGIITLFAVIGGAAIGTQYLARRYTRVTVEELIRTDKRPPILFLRSFRDDQIKLAPPRRLFFRWLFALGEPPPMLDHVLVEETAEIGPPLAIGMPGRPPPFGAARTYLDDEEWRAGVATFAERARTIVIVIDDTEGIIWELSHIRESGYTAKTLFLLPPRLAAPEHATRILNREAVAVRFNEQDANRIRGQLANISNRCIGVDSTPRWSN